MKAADLRDGVDYMMSGAKTWHDRLYRHVRVRVIEAPIRSRTWGVTGNRTHARVAYRTNAGEDRYYGDRLSTADVPLAHLVMTWDEWLEKKAELEAARQREWDLIDARKARHARLVERGVELTNRLDRVGAGFGVTLPNMTHEIHLVSYGGASAEETLDRLEAVIERLEDKGREEVNS